MASLSPTATEEKKGTLEYDNKLYYYKSEGIVHEYYKCVKSECKGRVNKSKEHQEFKITQEHTCLVSIFE